VQIETWNTELDGPFSEAALRRKLESRGFSVARYVYPPGTYFPRHTHSADKMDAVVSGRFRIGVQGGEAVLKSGDALFVPAGVAHSAEVVGNESVVSLDGVRDAGWQPAK
jgi:quercetin dioxygenase-like cupin family protein